jgi:hypothetical protein
MQQDKMKIGRGMASKPFEDALEDSNRTFVIVKPCGFCNKGFHYMHIAITFHPFHLGAMLKESTNIVYVM